MPRDNPLLEYFLRDVGREDPRRMMERYATVIEQLSGYRLDPLPEVEYATRGDIIAIYANRSPYLPYVKETPAGEARQELFQALHLTREQNAQDNGLDDALWNLAGMFDPQSKKIRLVTRAGGQARASTLLHEMVHAGQDRTFALQDYQDRHCTSLDASLAASALLEGQAETVTLLHLVQSYAPDSADEYLDEVGDQLMQRFSDLEQDAWSSLSTFPYTAGAAFVLQRYRQDGEKDFAGMLKHVPISTEQVLHRDKFLKDERPARPPSATRAELLSQRLGGELGFQDTLGEMLLNRMVFAGDAELADRAAAGWNGDSAILIKLPGNARVVVLDTLWDSDRDVEEFAEQLAQWPYAGPDQVRSGAAHRVIRDKRRVLLLLAPEGSLDKIQDVMKKMHLLSDSALSAGQGTGQGGQIYYCDKSKNQQTDLKTR